MYQPQQNSNNNQVIENNNGLENYLEKTLKFKGKFTGFKYNPKYKQYQFTIEELQLLSETQGLKLDSKIIAFSIPKIIVDIGAEYDVEFEATPWTYYTYKKVEGEQDIKIKNYGLKILDIIDYEQPDKGEK